VEPQPFEQVVEEHGPTVLRVCRSLLGENEAQDAWSETFLSALRAYPDLPEGSNVVGWLVTIAHRRSIDQMRVTSRSPVPSAALPERDAGRAASCDELPGDPLRRVLRSLPPKQRGAVIYRYLVDLSYDEVGELIGSSPTAARRSAADGIAALRRAMDQGAM